MPSSKLAVSKSTWWSPARANSSDSATSHRSMMIGTIGRSFSDARITSRATWGEAIDVGEMTRRNHRQRSIAFVISVRHRSPASIPARSIHTEIPAASSWPEIFSTNRRSCREYEMNNSDIDNRA